MRRLTVDGDGEIVVLLIGMRVNRWRAVRAWVPVFRRMAAMLRQLSTERERGLRGYRAHYAWRTVTVVQYWRGHEELQRFAHDTLHRDAWTEYFRRWHPGGAVGVWHETYKVPSGAYEAVYDNMPVTGLAAATAPIPVTPDRDRALDRMNRHRTGRSSPAPRE